MAQPLDPKSFEPAGNALPIAEGVGAVVAGQGASGRLALFAVSENGTLAYLTGDVGGATQLRWFDRAGKAVDAVRGRASYNNVALARDAKRAAVVQTEPQTNNTDIWLIDLARGIPTRFTFDDSFDWDPVWSPDNTRIAFSSNRGHNAPSSISMSRMLVACDLRSNFRSPTFPSVPAIGLRTAAI